MLQSNNIQFNSNYHWSAMSLLKIRKIRKATKATAAGLLIMFSAIGSAHSELSIQEKAPEASVINRYAALKNADARSTQLHQLIAELNQRVSSNPNDALAWELLAQIYYNNRYHAYAVYAASEAIDRGYSTTKLNKILLNSSAIISQSQLQADYLTEDVDAEFLKEYQHALSRIYGEIYGFNYDESLPKPPAPVVRPKAAKAKSSIKAHRSAPAKKKAQTASKTKVVVQQKSRPAPKATPVKKSASPAPAKSSGLSTADTDPFKILR